MMAKRKKILLCECENLEEYLKNICIQKAKANHNGRTFWEAYDQIKLNLKPVQENVSEGAMAEGIKECISSYKEQIDKIIESGESVDEKIYELLSSDHIVFLNDHGPAHIEKVIDHAFSILKSTNQELNELEAFVLLCAIQVHDIGNILGRVGHERKLTNLFDEYSKNIILDTPEKRIIKSIAMAHGGKNQDGGKDTISILPVIEPYFDWKIRIRFLSALLRFSDELADDSSRANRTALDLGIIGIDSEIYHNYSKALHTVKIEYDSENNDHRIILVYELEEAELIRTYKVGNNQKYLLDEIYDRTLKMEQERRYCMKFMHPYVDVGRIDVTINIYNSNLQPLQPIKYRLEDILYPDTPQIGCIKDISKDIPSGEELALKQKGEDLLE